MLKHLLCFGFILAVGASKTALAEGEPNNKPAEPFGFADFTWLNGNSRQTTPVLDSKYFTGQFSFDSNYVYDFNRPKDHTLVGSGNSGRTGEFQVQQLGVGGDFHYQNILGQFQILQNQDPPYSLLSYCFGFLSEYLKSNRLRLRTCQISIRKALLVFVLGVSFLCLHRLQPCSF